VIARMEGFAVCRDTRHVAARGDCLRDQPLHAQLGNHRACLCSDCRLCLLIMNIKQQNMILGVKGA